MLRNLLLGLGICFLLEFSVLTGITSRLSCYAATSEEQSERLQIINASVISFRPAKSRIDRCTYCLTAGVSLGVLPEIDGTVGNKEERTDFLPVIPKPKVKFTLPYGIAIEGHGVPPITIIDVTPTIFAFHLEKFFVLKKNHILSLDLVYTQGNIIAPVTLPDAADTFDFWTNTGMLVYHHRLSKKLFTHLGVGSEQISTEFLVEVDGTLLTAEDTSTIFVGGFEWLFSKYTSVGFEQFVKSDIVSHFHLSAYYRF
ncbi:MAG: hypothetical protein HRU09_19100 [Oligoflexales bacterium]|nr:hypothetical protein [Oligoflexales bacterium]